MSLFNDIKSKINKNKLEIAVIGLGYVGFRCLFFFKEI